ncbi:MAG: hypothetical protein AAGI70_16080 [Pseudomonadota bacterium]
MARLECARWPWLRRILAWGLVGALSLVFWTDLAPRGVAAAERALATIEKSCQTRKSETACTLVITGYGGVGRSTSRFYLARGRIRYRGARYDAAARDF